MPVMTLGGSSTATATVAAVYDRTARVYDRFTADHDYELWLGNLLPALERDGLVKGRLLDVGCGTGKSFIPMLDRGWSVTGVDVSKQMLDLARVKAGPDADLHVIDMRSLPALGEFELVWSLDDAVNYLLSHDELDACVQGLRRNLSADGLCVFDVNTLSSYRGFFASTEVIDAEPERLIWNGHATSDFAPGAVATATLEIQSARACEQIVHRQRHFPPHQVEEALASNDLELVAVYGITTAAVLEQPLDESRHTKAIFVSRPAQRR
jgi:predicted TPR repeat methyltransferase